MNHGEIRLITVRTEDGFQTHCQKMFFYVYDKHLDLAEAISLAVAEYINYTEKGKQEFKERNFSFTWIDFWNCVPNEICQKYGFEKVPGSTSSHEVSWDEEIPMMDLVNDFQEVQESVLKDEESGSLKDNQDTEPSLDGLLIALIGFLDSVEKIAAGTLEEENHCDCCTENDHEEDEYRKFSVGDLVIEYEWELCPYDTDISVINNFIFKIIDISEDGEKITLCPCNGTTQLRVISGQYFRSEVDHSKYPVKQKYKFTLYKG